MRGEPGSQDRDSQVVVVVFDLGQSAPEVDTLLDGMRMQGVSVQHGTEEPLGHPPDAAVVILSAQTDSSQLESLPLDEIRDLLIPVSLGDRASVHIPELSHIVLEKVGYQKAAEQIANAARARGADRFEYYALARRAAAWSMSDEANSSLLTSAEASSALRLLSGGASASVPGSGDEVRAFVQASLNYRRRRQRRSISMIAGTVAVLAAATITALLFQSRAQASAAAAQREGDAADSSRWSAAAASLIPVDPDLPVLLAAEALSRSANPQSLEAARRVLATQVPHMSVELTRTPAHLSSATSAPKLLVQYLDGTSEVRDSGDGRLLVEISHPLDIGAWMSPDGSSIAGSYGGKVYILAADDSSLQEFDSSLRPLAWIDTTDVLLGGEDPERLNTSTGRLSPLSGLSGPAEFAVVSPTGSHLAYLGGGKMTIATLPALESSVRVDVPDAIGAGFSGDGNEVVVARGLGEPVQAFDTKGKAVYEDGVSDLAAVDANPGPGDTVALTLGAQSIGLVSLGTDGTVDRGAQFVASRALHAAQAKSADGRLLTAGTDRYLRIWSEPERTTFTPLVLASPLDLDGRYGARVDSRQRPQLEANNEQLTYIPDSNSATITAVSTLNPQSLQRAAEDRIWGPRSGLTLAPGGRYVIEAASGGLRVSRVAEDRVDWATSNSVTCVGPPTAPIAVSPDGNVVACAGREGIYVADRSSPMLRVLLEDHSLNLSLMVQDSGKVTSFESNGVMRDTEGALVRIAPAGESIVAATASADRRTVFSVTGAGVVYRYSDSSIKPVAETGGDVMPIALELSEQERTLFVIGKSDLVALSSDSGDPLVVISTRPGKPPFRDAVAVDNAVVLADLDGRLERISIPDTDALLDELQANSPRELNDIDRRHFRIS